MATFANKHWNADRWAAYLQTIPRVKTNSLLESGVLERNAFLDSLFSNPDGGNFGTMPITGRLSGDSQNFDGVTDMTYMGLNTFIQTVVAYERMAAWSEKDFTAVITGHDFMEDIAQQQSDFMDDDFQKTLISVLTGVYAMGVNDFTTNHTMDISNEAGTAAYVDITTILNAAQQACGENMDVFTDVFLPSKVATNIGNKNLVEYLKYTDKYGVEKYSGLRGWSGKTLHVDDSLPKTVVKTANGTAGVYTLTVKTALTSGDKVAVTAGSTGKVEYSFTSGTTSKSAQATAIAALFENDTVFTVTASSDTVVFTQKSNGFGAIPTVDNTDSTTGELEIALTTSGVLPTYKTIYTVYVMGKGAISYADLPIRNAYEVARDHKTAGGIDIIAARWRKVIAPKGISFLKESMVTNSPTNLELASGSNWGLVSGTNSGVIDHRVIPIARIICVG